MKSKIRIGIDITGVIADHKKPCFKTNRFTLFSLEKGALKSIEKMVKNFGSENVSLISCSTDNSLAFITGIWLEHHKIIKETNLSLDNIFITKTIKEKSAIAKRLKLTHMIDNRLDVLDYFPEEIKLIAFKLENTNKNKFKKLLQRAIRIENWKEVDKYFDI